jgi:hypothetical protein
MILLSRLPKQSFSTRKLASKAKAGMSGHVTEDQVGNHKLLNT